MLRLLRRLVTAVGETVKEPIYPFRRVVVVVVQLVLVAGSNYASWLLRYDADLPEWAVRTLWQTLPLLVVLRGLIFVPFRIYQGLWRYTGIHDLRQLLAAIGVSSVAYFAAVWILFGFDAFPRSIFLIDAVCLTVLLGGIRMSRRVYLELLRGEGTGSRTLIYGAGNAGEMIVREMRMNPAYGYAPVGFIDDDPRKRGQRIHGVPVLGDGAALAGIIERERPDAVLIALPSAAPATTRRILRSLEPFNLPIKTLPNLRDVLDGTVTVTQIRSLSVEDLLSRAAVGLDPEPVRRLVAGKRVLVTGAAGSIGSELCRQIATFRPERLYLVDRYENGLYEINEEFAAAPALTQIEAVVADISDAALVDRILSAARADIVFHAAAHKHVPMMERCPAEAVKNNVGGTRVMVEAAARHGVGRFVFISSDKAVNPCNVMGATKRVGELIVRAAGVRGGCITEFVTVRFGNVLGSNGSVVPKFLRQIRAGGPVTVTHPQMTRFFMLIPEAVQLVLHAASLGGSGATYVLDMGDPVAVVDMARHLIRLSGHVPDEDMQIAYIGLRPGEKMFEELVGAGEVVESSCMPKILRIASTTAADADVVAFQVVALEQSAAHGDDEEVLRRLVAVVPDFVPTQDGAPWTAAAPAVEPV